MDYERLLAEIAEELAPYRGQGTVADYIPELAHVPPDRFGICLHCLDGRAFTYGDAEEPFTIQSISKVFSLTVAFGLLGDSLWERVGIEPAGTRFNSLVQLEYERGIPRNPFINSGAIVIADVLCSEVADPKNDMLEFVRNLAQDPTIRYDETVAASEMQTGYRNAALGYLLKSFGNLHNDVEAVLDLYFHLCAIEMNCRQLARSFAFFANHGQPEYQQRILTRSQTKRLNALMQTCGFYDEAGEFTFKVGLPGKSGVGGGIAAVHPGAYSVAVWSPRLNAKGNSLLGLKALELLTTKLETSIF